jgi:hypothetical protein
MGGDAFETVLVTTDPAVGEMLVETLRGEGIAARLLQVNAALLGAGPQVFQTKVQVPAPFAARARELVGELEHVGTLEAFSEARGPGIGEPEAPPAPSPRRPVLGAGIAFLLPGGGHLYARRTWTAIVLEAGLLACLAILATDRETVFVANAAFASVFAILVCDSAGTWRLLRASAAAAAAVAAPAARPSPGRQVARGLVLLAIAAAAGTAVASAVNLPRWLRARQLATLVVECSGEGVAVTNRGPTPRLVTVGSIGITARELPENGAYRVELDGDANLTLAPGGADGIRFAVPERLARACVSLEDLRPGDCRVVFSLEARDPAVPDGAPLAARGSCAPDWSAPSTMVRAQLTPEVPR